MTLGVLCVMDLLGMIVNGSYRVQCLRTLMGKMASDEHNIDVSVVAGMYAMFIVYAGPWKILCPVVHM